jgi:DNA-binding LacI/PurR family transcriptional regulator
LAAKRRPTIADIALMAGVSKGSVSYALNGRPGVSEATRRKILSIADDLGWRPSFAARAVSGGRANACGLVLARSARTLAFEPFFMELISGIESELSGRSLALVLQLAADLEAEANVLRRWWSERRIDGVLLVDLRNEDPRIELVEELGLPAVVIGGPGRTGNLPTVWADDAASMREAVRYLVLMGHRIVGRVSGPPEFRHTSIRSEAFWDTLKGSGASGIEVSTDFSGEAGARVTRELLTMAERPTALIYDNDVMAVAGLGVAHEMGLDVPADLSIIAWDDSPLCRIVHPQLTAMSRDIPAYGAHAAQRLLALLEQGDSSSFEDERSRLTPRTSTAPAPKGR